MRLTPQASPSAFEVAMFAHQVTMRSAVSRFWNAAGLLLGFAGFVAAPLRAETPAVYFDLPPLVAVEDVSTPEARETGGERLLRARFAVSALLRRGDAADLVEYQFSLASPRRALHIVDYSPKTALATDVAGTIHQESTEGGKQSAGVNLTAKYESFLTSAANLGGEHTSTACTKLDRLPPLELVSAAGTLDGGRAVYLKLRPSPRTTLEGTHEMAITFRAPREWRADFVVVRCAAQGLARGATRSLDQRTTAGQAAFVVSLFDPADPTARKAAERLVAAVDELHATAMREQKAIERASWPNSLQKFTGGSPQIPADWLGTVLYQAAGGDAPSYLTRLPVGVSKAAAEVAAAKRQLQRLSGA